MLRVEMTDRDVDAGIAGDCYRCPAALALRRATGDAEANVYISHGPLYVEVWGRHVPAPAELREFALRFDELPRDDSDRPDPTHPDYRRPDPIAFELPDLDSGEWEERCDGCEGLFGGAGLDEEGYCAECRGADP